MVRRDDFVRAREERWRRLEELLRRAGRGRYGQLTGDDLMELGRLYQAATGDLATAHRDLPGDRVVDYLNGLTLRAHGVVYRGRPATLRAIGRFIRYGFPAAYRESGGYIALAFGLFLVSAIIAAGLVAWRDSMADILMPGTAAWMRGVMSHHHLWMKSATSNHSVAANFIMTNNIQVAFLAFAGGVLLGVGSVFVLVENGISLGATAALVARFGLSGDLWSFVFPHGVIELSVIFASAGAGLMIGDAILRPGNLRRQDAVTAAARRAAYVLIGCVPLLVIAGTIEGFFSPSDAPGWLKILAGIATGILLYGYLLLSRPRQVVRRYELEDVMAPGRDAGRLSERNSIENVDSVPVKEPTAL